MRKIFSLVVFFVSTVSMAMSVKATTVTWVGGNGTWYAGTGVWSTSGGNVGNGSAKDEFGREDGWRGNGAFPNRHAVIDGPSSQVLYQAHIKSDFRWRSSAPQPQSGITVSGGATFNIESRISVDGKWTQFDSQALTVTGPGSLWHRFNTPAPTGLQGANGGAMVFGSWKGYEDPAGQDVNFNALDYGEFRNKGQLWFGAYGKEYLLNATMTIGEGAKVSNFGALEKGVTLSGNVADGTVIEGEFNFIYSYANADTTLSSPHKHDYKWDFTGHGGNLTVGEHGIRVQEQTSANGAHPVHGFWVWGSANSTLVSGRDLWNGVATPKSATDQILHSGGLNKSTAASSDFDDYFVESGTVGNTTYSLTSISGAAAGGSHPGDINGDFKVDGADLLVMFERWTFNGTNPGTAVAHGDINSTVPGDDMIDGADFLVLASNWTGDPGPVASGKAAATYNPATGQLVVSATDINSWYIEWVHGDGMTGPDDVADVLPNNGGLVTNAPVRVGEASIGLFSFTDLDLGRVAATGLPDDGSLRIFWSVGLGGTARDAAVVFVPEPTSLALIALGSCGIVAPRRRGVTDAIQNA